MDQQNAGVASAPDRDVRTAEIRAEIDRTREDLSETVDAIQDRLRPSAIASSTAERVKQATSDTVHELAESDAAYYVNDNRWPIAMIGVGVAGLVWLTSRRDGQSARPAWRGNARAERWDNPAYRPAGTSTRAAAYNPGPGAYDYQAERTTHGSAGMPRRYATNGPSYFQRAWRANPLLVGAAAAAVGAIVGLGVPETERENELMGETRDNMVAGIGETVRSKVDEVQRAASDAVNTVQNAAKHVTGLTTDDNRPPGAP
jgi:hypothetical protein